MGTIADKLQKLLDTKRAIKAAITAMGQSVADSLPFSSYPDKIRAIQTGVDTSDATAAASDILTGKTAYAGGRKISGTIPVQAAQTITPGTTNKTIAAGRYLSGTQTIKGDAGLKPENIRKGVTVFGVAGTCDGIQVSPADMTLTVAGEDGFDGYWTIDVIYPDGSKQTDPFYTQGDVGPVAFRTRQYGTYTIHAECTMEIMDESEKQVTFTPGGATEQGVFFQGVMN